MSVHPDAVVTNGIITDIKTGDELPSYEGLVLSNAAGRFCILFTTLSPDGRNWEFVHWGSQLSSTEIDKFMRIKKNESI